MWRIHATERVSSMVNLARAKDAAGPGRDARSGRRQGCARNRRETGAAALASVQCTPLVRQPARLKPLLGALAAVEVGDQVAIGFAGA